MNEIGIDSIMNLFIFDLYILHFNLVRSEDDLIRMHRKKFAKFNQFYYFVS